MRQLQCLLWDRWRYELLHKERFSGNSSSCATQGLVVGVASSPEHQYEKLNYELMKKTPIDLKLNSLGRCCTIQRDELRGFTYFANFRHSVQGMQAG